MSEEIEDKLKETYENIEVEYYEIRTYKIKIYLKGNIKTGIIRTILIFYYKWDIHSTFSTNIEFIKYNIKNI